MRSKVHTTHFIQRPATKYPNIQNYILVISIIALEFLHPESVNFIMYAIFGSVPSWLTKSNYILNITVNSIAGIIQKHSDSFIHVKVYVTYNILFYICKLFALRKKAERTFTIGLKTSFCIIIQIYASFCNIVGKTHNIAADVAFTFTCKLYYIDSFIFRPFGFMTTEYLKCLKIVGTFVKLKVPLRRKFSSVSRVLCINFPALNSTLLS